MNPTQAPVADPRAILRLMAAYRWRWLAPTLAASVLALAYALLVPPTWQASQTLLVRNEATGGDSGLGKFNRTEDLKNIQEMILELAKSRGVLQAALTEVGPPADYNGRAAWPTDRDIDDLRQTVKVAAPKGIEFGTAEVFCLDTRDHDRVRAVRINEAIARQLQARFQEIRDAKAQSMIAELDKTAHLAKADLDEAAGRLAAIEKQVGSDLPELRVLHESNAGEGNIRRTVSEVENELRQARAATEASRQLLDMLAAAGSDPGHLLAASGRLLDSQPGLKRLKDGLVDAQLRTASLQGKMTATHPAVVAAKEAEEEVGRHLHAELAIAIRGAEADVKAGTTRAATLETQLAKAKERMAQLAELRTPYASHVAEAAHRTRLAERAEQSLAEARAAQASAKAASLISPIDSPDTGVRPVSPSRATILAAGLLGGLLAGLGVLLMTVRLNTTETVPAAPELAAEAEVVPVRPSRTAVETAQPSPAPAYARGGSLTLKQALQRIGDGSGV